MRRLSWLLALAPLCGCNWVFGIENGLPEDGTNPTPSAGPPVYLAVAEITAIKARVDAGDEPWASAYPLFLQDVEAAATLEPRSVIDNGAGAEQSDARVFATDSLTTDCVVGLSNERHDYCTALLMGQAARDLALSWHFTGNDAHARTAIDHIHHFLLDETTGVLPSATNGGPHSSGGGTGSPIELTLYVPPFAYAASLLVGHPHWAELATPDAEGALETWLRTFRASAVSVAPGSGNRLAYHLNAIASIDAYLDDDAALDATFGGWRTFVDDVVDADGLVAGTSDNYYFWLEALVLTAQIASYRDVDLYGHVDADGVVLERAFEAYAPCLSGGSCPQAVPDGGGQLEGASMTELAYSAYQSPSLLEAIEAVGRPAEDIRILGWTTLTHGNAFDR